MDWKLWFRSNRVFVPRLVDPETHRDGTRDGKGAFLRFCVSFPNAGADGIGIFRRVSSILRDA